MRAPPTQASRARREVAARIGRAYASNPSVAAVVLGGSAAQGHADRFSDVEIGVFWHEAPTDDDRREAIEAAGGEIERLYPYDPSEGVATDDWKIGRRGGEPKTGISVDMPHFTTRRVDETFAAVVARHDSDPRKQNLVAGIVYGIPLHGHALVERWQDAAAPYPDGLARAVVAANAHVAHFWRFEMFRERDNPLFAAAVTADVHERLLLVLLAINRVYYFGLKSLDAVGARLDIAPRDLVPRLRATYSRDLGEAERLLAGLVEDTYDLVEAHQPDVDVERLRTVFRYRRPLWDDVPDDLASAS